MGHGQMDCAIEDIEMSRKIESGMEYQDKAGSFAVVLMLATTLSPAIATAQAVTEDVTELRSSESLGYAEGGRTNMRDPAKGSLSVDEYAPLEKAGSRSRTVNKSLKSSTYNSASQTDSPDFWIYDANVELFYDDDGDGYFYGVDLLFDADTIYNSADVYAAVYLSYEGGPWNEYAVTDDFTIYGESGSDEYVLVTELMSGYPTGEYDLLIELYDAYDGSFVASFGPEDSSGLAYLPLEDFGLDAPVVEQRVVITRGGGGAFGIWMLVALVGLIFGFRLFARKRAPTAL